MVDTVDETGNESRVAEDLGRGNGRLDIRSHLRHVAMGVDSGPMGTHVDTLSAGHFCEVAGNRIEEQEGMSEKSEGPFNNCQPSMAMNPRVWTRRGGSVPVQREFFRRRSRDLGGLCHPLQTRPQDNNISTGTSTIPGDQHSFECA